MKGFSHGGAGLDVGRGRTGHAAPVPQRPGHELGTIVHAQVLGRSPLGDEALYDRDDGVGVTGSAHPHGQSLPGVLVDDVQQLQPPAIGGLVELEVQGPHLVRALRPQQLAATGWAGPLAPARGRPAQALLPPQALRALAVDGPALPAKDGVGGLPAPAGVRPGDGSQSPSELVLLGRAGTAHQALGGAVLAGHPTGTALGDPEALRQDHHGPTTALRG